MKVPLLDLKAQFTAIEPELRAAIDGVLARQSFILGPDVEACERDVAAYCGARHGIGVSSGTDALLVALMALDIKPGDEVITTAYSFFATAGVIVRLGARPVFVDIDPADFTLDPVAVAAAVTPKSRAIIVVHLFGQCADMAAITAIARRHGLAVIEDAAQAIGAELDGVRAGRLGDVACFSFFPSKNLGAFGDGGMVVTGDDALAERIRVLRVHGAKPKYHHRLVGGNFRLDAIQAAVVRAKLPHLDGWTARRRDHAALYDRLLAGVPGIVTPPVVRGRPVFNQYVVRVRERDRVRDRLTEAGIGTEVYYPVPLHRQECFSELGYGAGRLPEAERAAAESLALPVYPELTDAQIEWVAASLIAAAGAL